MAVCSPAQGQGTAGGVAEGVAGDLAVWSPGQGWGTAGGGCWGQADELGLHFLPL